MKRLCTIGIAMLIAIGLGVASAAAHPASRPAGTTGGVEYQFLEEGAPPHPALVFPKVGPPWFGWAGARVYLSWQDGDPEAVIYLPPSACQWAAPGLRPTDCASVCPAPISCFVGHSTYRHSSPTDRRAVVVWDALPFWAGDAGTPVRLTLPGDGTARWVLP